MAEGGEDSTIDDVDEGIPQFQRQLSHQEVGDQAAVLLRHFIIDRFERDSIENAPRQEDLGVATPGQEEVWQQVGSTLREIGHILDQDRELQRMINSVPTDSPIEAIIAVAHVIFGDGEIHWGRIIGLFYFAYRMCVRAMDNILRSNFPGWVNQLVREIVKFLVRRFADWIIRRGGWTAITEYFGSSTPAWATLVLISMATMAIGLYKLKK
ncbi:apoptosis regulator BAX-like [Asterias rubens]|uniref:apoptosis regulator BAX-like n=1 Tax=Asterias rubens TaxID=7604 RepID=UPI001455A252|nr:apoptosis regulator BAX-like [Asterias rubens]